MFQSIHIYKAAIVLYMNYPVIQPVTTAKTHGRNREMKTITHSPCHKVSSLIHASLCSIAFLESIFMLCSTYAKRQPGIQRGNVFQTCVDVYLNTR